MKLSKLDKASRTAILDCMGCKKSEKILIITDENKKEIGYSLFENAKNLGFESLYVEVKSGKMHGEEPPAYVADLMTKFDVVMIPTSKSFTHTNARRSASQLGARIATFPGITNDVMIRGLNADYAKIADLTLKLTKILGKTDFIRITSPAGTDLSMEVKGRKVIPSKGLFHKKGESGNLPTGEAFLAPLEGKSNGKFVVDGSMAGIGVIKENISIEVKRGYATEITGGKEAKSLIKILEKYGKKARNIAEFGIGTNEKAKLSGILLEDEKVLGTVHIALGNNISMGGNVDVPLHLDGVIKKPTVYFDAKMIMKNGKLLI